MCAPRHWNWPCKIQKFLASSLGNAFLGQPSAFNFINRLKAKISPWKWAILDLAIYIKAPKKVLGLAKASPMACNALLYYASNEQPPSVCMDNWVQSELSPKITVLVEWNLCIKEMWSAIGNFKRLKVNQLNRTKCKNICTIHRATYLLEKRTIDTKNTVFIQLPNHTYKQEMFFPSIKHKHCVWLSTRSLELQLTLNKVLAIICESCPRTCSHPYLLSTPERQ